MKSYDIILWGKVDGEECRTRDPVVSKLDAAPKLGQRINEGDIAEVDSLQPRFPVEVVGVGEPETPGSESSIHIKERNAVPEIPLPRNEGGFTL